MICRRCGGVGQLWYPVPGSIYTRNDWCDKCGGTGDESKADQKLIQAVSSRLHDLFPPEWSPEELTLS